MAEETLTPAMLKAELLAHGVTPTKSFASAYGPPYLTKRRAYGNPDDLSFFGWSLPQEMYLGSEGVVCSVNVRRGSEWILDWSEGEGFAAGRSDFRTALSFPKTPSFYAQDLPDGQPVRSLVTLYGGRSIGMFVHGSCSLVEMKKACQYCSISPNRGRQTEFPLVISEESVLTALRIALADRGCPALQVMINGGNFRDPDRSFRYYLRVCRMARQAIDESGREVELHLIVYPPDQLDVLGELGGLRISVAMNLEVFDPLRFKSLCPGKDADHIFKALVRAVEVLGPGNVFSILVGGLEEQESMDRGMKRLMERGIIPVINVFHPDPETPLSGHPAPSAQRILRMGRSLQEVYSAESFARPFYLECGRNSLDTEAHYRMF